MMIDEWFDIEKSYAIDINKKITYVVTLLHLKSYKVGYTRPIGCKVSTLK